MNEYDESTRFYKLFKAEAKLRAWASIFPNAYLITIFACCRQIYQKDEMEGKGILIN